VAGLPAPPLVVPGSHRRPDGPAEDPWAGAPRRWPPDVDPGRGARPPGYPPPYGGRPGAAGPDGGAGGVVRGGGVGPALEARRGGDGWPAGPAGAPVYEVLTPDAVVGPGPVSRSPAYGWPVDDDGDGGFGAAGPRGRVSPPDGDGGGAGAARPHPPRAVVRRRARRRRLLEWPVLVAASLAAAVLIRLFVLETFFIPSPSMHPTLVEHDRVLVNKLSYHLHDVHRGDVVVFRRPPNLHVTDKDLIKRVIGLPGDTVEARGGNVYVNGRLLREPYVPARCKGTQDFLRVAVPSDHVFVMGDNRCDSTDSRVFGPISVDLLVGRAFVRWWPPGRFGWL
jgi:signal peptidase I